ncbi:C2H2 and C2HC zinc fingers superfamily protein [Carex rostrata]
MTEYWVSQGNKWCEFCKIYISNNPASIRTHELGKRHKDTVALRLANMQKEGAAKEKEQKAAARALEQIEAKAKKSYQKDLASFQGVSSSPTVETSQRTADSSKCSAKPGSDWEFDSSSGYYYNKLNGFHYDKNSDLYYSAALGKWVTLEEASKSGKVTKPDIGQPSAGTKSTGAAPGLVVSKQLNPTRNTKGAPSSIAVNKRKRGDAKPKTMSKEEEEAIKAREAARKRVEDREKPLLGLYRAY